MRPSGSSTFGATSPSPTARRSTPTTSSIRSICIAENRPRRRRRSWRPSATSRSSAPTRFRFEMSSGNADLPFILSDYHILVVPNGFTDWNNPIGTAGYVLEHYEAGVRCIVKKTRPYWKAGCANVDSIETLTINDVSARTAALLSGQVDAINRLDARTVNLLKRRSKFHVIQSAAGQHGVFVMNCTDSPYNDNNVRMALKYGIDRKQIVDTVLKGYGHVGNDQPILSPMNSMTPACRNTATTRTRPSSTSRRRASRTSRSSFRSPMSPSPAPQTPPCCSSRPRRVLGFRSPSSSSRPTAIGTMSG